MFNKYAPSLMGLVVLFYVGSVLAQAKPAADSGSLLKRKSVEETIINSLQQARPDMKFGAVRPSPIAGLYQAQVVGQYFM